MSPFEFSTYRDYLRFICQGEVRRGTQARLAKAAGCQASYFSQMLRDRVHLTEDQVLGVAEELNLSYQDLEHFMLLFRWEKAGTEKLKKFLGKSLEESRKNQLNLGKQVGAEHIVYSDEDLGKYFSTWIPSALHLLTSCEKYRTVEDISARLHLPLAQVRQGLDLLSKMGFVQNQGDQWFYARGSLHVAKKSPIQPIMQIGRRALALRAVAENREESVHFSSVFTIDKTDFDEIKKLVAKFINSSHEKIKSSGAEELYCLNIDLFEVV